MTGARQHCRRRSPIAGSTERHLELPCRQLIGPLLELIARHGSISRAAEEMSMSYRRAWLLADDLNHISSTPVLETQHGGSSGWHARSTPFGLALVGHYRALEARSMKLFQKQLAELAKGLAARGELTTGSGVGAQMSPFPDYRLQSLDNAGYEAMYLSE